MGARRIRTRTMGIRTAAVAIRLSSCKPASAPDRLRGVMVRVAIGQATVAPFTLLIFLDALQQVSTTEFGPQCGSHIDLGVGKLPEKKITQPHFAAGADNQIGIGQM